MAIHAAIDEDAGRSSGGVSDRDDDSLITLAASWGGNRTRRRTIAEAVAIVWAKSAVDSPGCPCDCNVLSGTHSFVDLGFPLKSRAVREASCPVAGRTP